MKRIISYLIIFTLFGAISTMGLIYADNEQDELNDINNKISKTQTELNEGKKKESALNKQIKQIEGQIKSTENEINQIKGNISKTESNIEAVRQNLAAVEAEMNQQNQELNNRLRTMYKNGDIGLVQILLGSEDITDFMTNMDMVQRIFDNDVEILKTMEEQHQKIEIQKKQLETLQAQLISEKQAEADKQNSLVANRGLLYFHHGQS